MYTSGADPVSVQDHLTLDLASLFAWVTSNGFAVNVSKSQSMLLARRNRRHQLSSMQFLLNDNVLQLHKSVKYLGINVDEGLSWSEQIRYVRRSGSLSALLLFAESVCVYLLMFWLLCTMLLFYPTSLTAVWFGISVPSQHLKTFNLFRIMQ